MKSTKAARVRKLLQKGYSVREIKEKMKVSESYIYVVKKLMAAGVEAEVEPKTGEYVVVDGAMSVQEIDAILNTRASTYGSFVDVSRMAQQLKTVAHTAAGEQGKTFAADQAEALDMIFSKLARILNGNPDHVDSWVDIAGYAKLVSDRLEGKIR